MLKKIFKTNFDLLKSQAVVCIVFFHDSQKEADTLCIDLYGEKTDFFYKSKIFY